MSVTFEPAPTADPAAYARLLHIIFGPRPEKVEEDREP